MPDYNRFISYSVNHLQWPGDSLIAGVGDSATRVGYLDSLPIVARLANEYPVPMPNVNYIVNDLVPQLPTGLQQSQNPLPIAGDFPTEAEVQAMAPGAPLSGYSILDNPIQNSIASYFGTDAKTLGKYLLLGVLAIVVIAIGIFALVSPGAKYIEREAKRGARAAA